MQRNPMLFSIHIISKGQEDLLLKCLNSLRVPAIEWELLIVSEGELNTEILNLGKSLAPRVRHLSNIQTACENSEGDWILFLRENVSLSKNYWEVCMPLILEPKVDVLGGPLLPAKGMNALSLSYEIALSSPFCTGMSFVRHRSLGKKLMMADEEKLSEEAIWIRKSLVKDFDSWSELLLNLKREGYHLFYHPKLSVGHSNHRSLLEMTRDIFKRGKARSSLNKKNLWVGSEVYWLPSIFVLLHLIVFIDTELFLNLAKLYLGVIGFVGLGLALRARKFYLFPLIGFFHYFVVVLYGVGFLYQRITRKPA